ncbi:hypothetical protein THII_3132 [Thioploca ingrica]|uniref:Uncharacterized protein n=1 Tax=Thioploca ingrica TaxID=40754 RepID=A0A090AJ38_9GAMM|nr:hypothetical protein THII_3132 [Thioploca ingrica]
MNKKLLITAMSIALMGNASMVANPVYAAPKNPTAIEASCKNNAEKKDWCQSQEQPAPSQDQNTTDNSTPNQDQNTTAGDTDDSENNTTGSEGNVTDTNNTTGENNIENSGTTDSNSTESENTTPPTAEELFTQAEEAGIFVSVEATIQWLVTNKISPEMLTEEQRNALPINWDLPQLPPVATQLTTNESEIVPAEGEVVPTEGAVVPTEGQVVPVEGAVVPTEGQVVPAEGAVVPTEGAVVPTENQVVPAEGAVVPTEGQVVPAEGAVVPTEGQVVPADSEVVPTENQVVPAEGAVVPTEGQVVPADSEVVPTEGQVVPIDSEVVPTNESLEPTDVEEPTFSPVVSEEEEQAIQAQLEVVNDVVVVDGEGNETLAPVEETKVIGEVLIPQAEEESANAVVNGELLNVEVNLGIAEATTADEKQEPIILTTVTGLEITAPTTEPETEVDTSNLITLQRNEAGNFILRIPNLKVGNLVVNVILRALTEKLDIYQVEEVTIAPEDVFNNEDSTKVEDDNDATKETVETVEVSDEEATKVAEETI